MKKLRKADGYVNFPLKDKRFHDTQEGGMFVRLVVTSPKWIKCFEGWNTIIMDGVFVGDDVEGWNSLKYHFPKFWHWRHTSGRSGKSCVKASDLHSTYYLAVLTIGSTKASLFSDKLGDYWACTYNDLTDKGKKLYDLLKELYGPESKIFLQTWLDT